MPIENICANIFHYLSSYFTGYTVFPKSASGINFAVKSRNHAKDIVSNFVISNIVFKWILQWIFKGAKSIDKSYVVIKRHPPESCKFESKTRQEATKMLGSLVFCKLHPGLDLLFVSKDFTQK